jgi:hypothetical protein
MTANHSSPAAPQSINRTHPSHGSDRPLSGRSEPRNTEPQARRPSSARPTWRGPWMLEASMIAQSVGCSLGCSHSQLGKPLNRLAKGCCTLRGHRLGSSFAMFVPASGPAGGPEKLIKMATDQLDRRLQHEAAENALGPSRQRPCRTARLGLVCACANWTVNLSMRAEPSNRYNSTMHPPGARRLSRSLAGVDWSPLSSFRRAETSGRLGPVMAADFCLVRWVKWALTGHDAAVRSPRPSTAGHADPARLSLSWSRSRRYDARY